MSPAMAAPLLVLAALLVFPGRMPEGRGAASTAAISTQASTPASLARVVTVVWRRVHGP